MDADQGELSRASFWRYHLIMTLCSVYMAMLLTNWGDSEDAEPTRRYNLGVASAWVQVAAIWTCSGRDPNPNPDPEPNPSPNPNPNQNPSPHPGPT